MDRKDKSITARALMSDIIAFHNGKYLPLTECQFSLFDYGVMQGVIIGEMIRTFRHQPFQLDAHIARLQYSLDQIGIATGYTIAELTSHVQKLVEANSRQIPADHDLGISIVVTPGINPVYAALQPNDSSGVTLFIYTFLLPMSAWADAVQSGQSVVIPEIRQLPRNTIDPRIKTRSRLHWYLADKQANQQVPGSRALLLNEDDCVTELSTANFFIVNGGIIQTPALGTTLGGVSQQYVVELAGQLGIACRACDISREDVLNADEAFSTSTPYCMLPVSTIDGQTIGSQYPGVVFNKLIKAWSDKVGVDIMNQIESMAGEQK